MMRMTQGSLFGELVPDGAKPHRGREELEVLITVKAAPNPSEKSGETVCVAGLDLGPSRVRPRWVRLYPINFRYLDQDIRFKKYDIVKVACVPAERDPRIESWRPVMETLRVVESLPPWARRRRLLDPVVQDSMCDLNTANQAGATGASLALVRAREVRDLRVKPHPGWSPDEQAKIERYVRQLDLFGGDRTPLEAPRMVGHFAWTCYGTGCRGHEQSIIDWEFVAFQRRLAGLDDATLKDRLRQKFLTEICHSGAEIAFYVGNQAKRHHVFHVLGVYYPK